VVGVIVGAVEAFADEFVVAVAVVAVVFVAVVVIVFSLDFLVF